MRIGEMSTAMQRVAQYLLIFLMLCVFAPAIAQTPSGPWRMRSDDSGSLIYGAAYLPDFRLDFSCTAPSPQGLPLMQTGSHESHRTDVFEMLIGFADSLFEWAMPYEQNGVVMLVDGRAFPLPPFDLNELQGTAVYLPMTAPVIQALYTAQSLALRTPQGVTHTFPVDGLVPSLDGALRTCINRWADMGHTIPVGLSRYWPSVGEGPIAASPPASGIPLFNLSGGAPAAPAVGTPLPGIPVFNLPAGAVPTPPVIIPETPSAPPVAVAATSIAQLPPVIPQHVRGICNGQARIEDDALRQAGDLDEDGLPDYLIHYTGVYCLPDNMRDFCGAANCTVDVFLSSRAYAPSFEFLAIDVVPASDALGRPGLQMFATHFMCAGGACDGLWHWDGQTFSQN